MLPLDCRRQSVRYAEMRHMIFGRVPSLSEIMATIRDLQDELNGIR